MNKSTVTLLNIIAVVAGIGVCVWLETSVFDGKSNAANVFGKMNRSSGSGMGSSVLDMTVSMLNSSCPKMLDTETQLDSVAKTAGNGFAEYFTLIHYDKAQIESMGLTSSLGNSLKENVKTNPGLAILRESNVTFYFIYRDKNGELAANVTVAPQDYR